MSNMPKPIAIGISDLHLSLQKPACRADKDWMAVQAGYLKQVRDLSYRLNQVPVLCAGDIFDRWNAPAELINFALAELPEKMLCIPGQHDLPEHRMDAIDRSAYATLVLARKVIDTSGDQNLFDYKFIIDGFGWGQHIHAARKKSKLRIALVHKYLWAYDKCYPGAPESSNIASFKKEFEGWNVIISGDNHQHFKSPTTVGGVIFNPGTFIRRKSDEISHIPCAAIIHDDGTVKPFYFNTEGDKFHFGVKDQTPAPINMRDFINQLESLGEHGLNFREEVERYLENNEVEEETRQIILRTIQQ